MGRKNFNVGDWLLVRNEFGDEQQVQVYSRPTPRLIRVRGDRVCGELKYYKNKDIYTVSTGMTNGKTIPGGRYEFVEFIA